jgi:hypothetical protein
MKEECGFEGHAWIADVSDGWRGRVEFLYDRILTPVVCEDCGAKGVQTWVFSYTTQVDE